MQFYCMVFKFGPGNSVQGIIVPQYTNLTIPAGAGLTAAPWNGTTGGVVAFMVQNTFTVQTGGKCDVSGLGFTGSSGGMDGSGGIGGIGGATIQNGGDSLLVLYSGLGNGGDGG
jgi:hypothetical protein